MYNKGHVYKILYENDNPVGNLTTDCCLKLTSRWLLSSCKNLYMRQTVVVNEEAKFSEKKKRRYHSAFIIQGFLRERSPVFPTIFPLPSALLLDKIFAGCQKVKFLQRFYYLMLSE